MSWKPGPSSRHCRRFSNLATAVALEGDNQKQADFLSRSLVQVDPAKIHDLHLLISSISRPEHLTLFDRASPARSIAVTPVRRAYAWRKLLEDGKLEIGAIHTYVELYARMFVDLMPDVALVCAEQADRQGNLYTGPNTEDTPTIVEATAFHDGVVVVQVNEIVDELPRVDIPASWVDVVVTADSPFQVEPLFTRDPRLISEVQILIAMLVIRGIYERHGVTTLNHGIGFDTAAIELLLPTYGEKLGLRGKICRNWVLNPHPTLIPAIESGWVESVVCFGSEVGMADYTRARPDVFFTGHDGSLRSNRVLAQLAGQYAVDLFIGSTLQMDARRQLLDGHPGAAGRLRRCPQHGQRCAGPPPPERSLAGHDHAQECHARGRKLVVQVVETFHKGGQPSIVDTLDAIAVGKKARNADRAGDDLRRRRHARRDRGRHRLSLQDRRPGGTQGGHRGDCRRHGDRPASGSKANCRAALPRHRGDSRGPRRPSNRRPPDPVGARSIDDLVAWSGGLYQPPAKFRSW